MAMWWHPFRQISPCCHVETHSSLPPPLQLWHSEAVYSNCISKSQVVRTGAPTAELDSSFKPLQLPSGADVMAW